MAEASSLTALASADGRLGAVGVLRIRDFRWGAGEGLRVAVVICEARLDLHGVGQVAGGEGVGRAGGARDVRVGAADAAYPLVGVLGVAQAVRVADPRGSHGEGLSHLHRPRDGRLTAGTGVGRPDHRCGGSAGEGFRVPGVVGEAHPHPDGVVEFIVGQQERAAGGAGDVGVRPVHAAYPLVVETGVAEAVVVGDAGHSGAQGFSHLCGAADGWRTRRRSVGRSLGEIAQLVVVAAVFLGFDSDVVVFVGAGGGQRQVENLFLVAAVLAGGDHGAVVALHVEVGVVVEPPDAESHRALVGQREVEVVDRVVGVHGLVPVVDRGVGDVAEGDRCASFLVVVDCGLWGGLWVGCGVGCGVGAGVGCGVGVGSGDVVVAVTMPLQSDGGPVSNLALTLTL